MATQSKKKKIDDQLIVSGFMQYVLEHDMYPLSVYKFCKEIKIEEEEFYKFYGSIDSLKKGVWDAFYMNATNAMNKNEEYAHFSSREKMLTFFYTFFELLTLNRSYVLLVLQMDSQPLKNLDQLKGLRKHVKNFAAVLIDDDNDEKKYKITKNPVSLYAEGAWLQCMFLLRFWKEDDSPAFEKTDIAIEKSVNTIFDVFDNTPLNNVLDFGKFLWKEKMV